MHIEKKNNSQRDFSILFNSIVISNDLRKWLMEIADQEEHTFSHAFLQQSALRNIVVKLAISNDKEETALFIELVERQPKIILECLKYTAKYNDWGWETNKFSNEGNIFLAQDNNTIECISNKMDLSEYSSMEIHRLVAKSSHNFKNHPLVLQKLSTFAVDHYKKSWSGIDMLNTLEELDPDSQFEVLLKGPFNMVCNGLFKVHRMWASQAELETRIDKMLSQFKEEQLVQLFAQEPVIELDYYTHVRTRFYRKYPTFISDSLTKLAL